MDKLLTIIFVLCALGSAISIALSIKFPFVGLGSLPEPNRSIKKMRRFLSALNTLVASFLGLAFLFLRILTGLETLIGILVVFGLIEVAIRNWKPTAPPRPPSVAKELSTGELLGEVVAECRGWSTGAIEGFKIRTYEGDLIERSADDIRIESQ
jgi:hypothetical protein